MGNMSVEQWHSIHEEYLGTGSRTLTVWLSKNEVQYPRVLFEVNEQGIYLRYYATAKDAIEGGIHIAEMCYGYVESVWERSESDEMFERIWQEQDSTEITRCEHSGTCEEQSQKEGE